MIFCCLVAIVSHKTKIKFYPNVNCVICMSEFVYQNVTPAKSVRLNWNVANMATMMPIRRCLKFWILKIKENFRTSSTKFIVRCHKKQQSHHGPQLPHILCVVVCTTKIKVPPKESEQWEQWTKWNIWKFSSWKLYEPSERCNRCDFFYGRNMSHKKLVSRKIYNKIIIKQPVMR